MVVCNVVVGFVVGLGVALVFEFVLGPANCECGENNKREKSLQAPWE